MKILKTSFINLYNVWRIVESIYIRERCINRKNTKYSVKITNFTRLLRRFSSFRRTRAMTYVNKHLEKYSLSLRALPALPALWVCDNKKNIVSGLAISYFISSKFKIHIISNFPLCACPVSPLVIPPSTRGNPVLFSLFFPLFSLDNNLSM